MALVANNNRNNFFSNKILINLAILILANPDIIAQLKRAILPLEGFKSLCTDDRIDIGFKAVEKSFPNQTFPIGCTHEFIVSSIEDGAATNGFVTCLLKSFMHVGGACIWISASRTLFPASLKAFGIEPERIIFIDLKKEKDLLYATEEALKCKSIVGVISEIRDISFKESRRLQLAAEQSRVTGFIIRNQPKTINTIACVSRWQITSLSSDKIDAMPGLGFPKWKVELLKVRSGKPGSWTIEWSSNKFNEIKETMQSIPELQIRKVG